MRFSDIARATFEGTYPTMEKLVYLKVLIVRVETVCGAVQRLREALVRLVSRQLVERPLLLRRPRRPLRTHVVRVREAQSVAST